MGFREARPRVRLRAFAALSALAMLGALACRGVQVPEPAEGTQPDDPREARCVDAPPPTAKLEELPAQPGEGMVWVDGAWTWRDGAWRWQPGTWAESPPGSSYVRPKLVRLANGALAWFPGHWHTREAEREARAFGRAPTPTGPVVCPAPSVSSVSSVAAPMPAVASDPDAGAIDAP